MKSLESINVATNKQKKYTYVAG